MKMKRILTLMLVLTMFVSSLHITAAAEDGAGTEIQPRLSNIYVCEVDFDITSTGFASIYFEYFGDPEVFESATVEIYLEKRFLGVFWNRVDIGMPNNVWIDVFYEDNGYVDHTLQLTKKGTYRARFVMTFRGTGNEDDELEKTVQATYE
ncbi:MAG: hypothetical protein IKJ04_08190 [Clostridia bacterium]|nr:hypothetical protein [Clostridia bacterium]MBR4034774.1 hypothetical protein [Clostridia bacterium]